MSMPHEPPIPDLLRSLLDVSNDPTFILDTEGRFTYANTAAAAMVRLTPDALIGRSLEHDFSGAFSPQWLVESRRARLEGAPVEYEAFNPAFGGWVRVLVTPGPQGLAVRIRNITLHRRTQALQAVTAALSNVRTEQAVAEVLLREAVNAAGAYMGALVVPTPDGEHLRLLNEVGYTPELRARFERFALSLDIPPCDAARRRTPVFVGGPTFDRQYPGSAGVRAEQTLSLAALPLLVEGHLWGVLALSFREVRHFDDAEQQFLLTLVKQGEQVLERLTSEALQQQQAEVLAVLNRLSRTISAELDLDVLVQRVTDVGVELTGAQFGALFYNMVNDRQENYILYTLSGVPREAFARFPMPRNTGVFGPTFRGEGVVRSADITRDPRYGQNSPYHGMPTGHLPVRSYLAVPVVSRSGVVLGGLFFGHSEPDVFSERAEQLVVGLAAQTAVAIDNARLYQQLQDSHAQLERRVEERTRELEAQAVSLDAFAAFTEAVGIETNVPALIRQAVATLRTRFPDASVGYYRRVDDLWSLQTWTHDMDPDVLASLQKGLPLDTPVFAEPLATHRAVFVDAWDAAREHIEQSAEYSAAGNYPLVVSGEVRGFLAVGRRSTPSWSDRDKALVSAVGRSLTLALERAEQTVRLEVQRDALEARTRALEAFALLTRDLSDDADPLELIRRAQEILMSLLGDGYTLYWQLEENLWRYRSLVGSLGHPDLQAVIDAGLPRGQAATLDRAWDTRQPVFEDQYEQGADTNPEVVRHVYAAAMLPVFVHGAPHGMIGMGLFEQRHWTPMEKAVLETVARSLGLALEGAQSARALQQRTVELERSNAELEQFAYIASHDLQAPLRAITSFADVITRRYGEHLDARGAQYLRQIVDNGTHMKRLVDDLLAFSRLTIAPTDEAIVDANQALEHVRRRLAVDMNAAGATLTAEPLPRVRVNAGQFEQLLQNLVHNGFKYHREEVAPRVHVSAQSEGPTVRFAVSDNGIGIEKKYFERIFEIFQRLHGRERYEGTGIGLAICKKIVERHGGRLWIDSTPGEGTTFFFTLPGAPRNADQP